MPESDLALLTRTAHEAGRIAVRYFDAAPKVWDKPAGAGPVSEADLAVNGMLREELTSARPGHGWLSEESEDSAARLSRPEVFIIDPIDGTRSFLEGGRDWSHSLAVARDGRIETAVVHLPLRDFTFAATRGGGATLNGAPVRVTATEMSEAATVLTAKSGFASEHWRDGVPPLQRHFRSSLAYRLCLVAEGRFDAMLTLRPTWEWDAAAGALIVEEAGGRVADRRGGALRFNNAAPKVDGLVAAGPTLTAALLDRLA